MKNKRQSKPTRLLCLLLSCIVIMTLIPATALTAEADVPERQIWLYVPAGVYDTVEEAMNAMYHGTDQYEDIVSIREDGMGVLVTDYADESVDVYPGFADNKLTDTIPSYDVGHMEYTFYGWQKLVNENGILTGSDEYTTYGSTMILPKGTAVYAAVYLKRPKTFDVTFRQADGILIPELGGGLIYGANLSAVKPTAEEILDHVAELPGYTFTFWGENRQDLSKPKDDGVDYFSEHTVMGDEPLTLWAHYRPRTFTVTYEVKDPYTGAVISSETREVTYGQPLAYDAVSETMDHFPAEPQVTGYTFTGWTDSAGKGYTKDSQVDFLDHITLSATFVPDSDQIFRAVLWYENDDGAWVNSGLSLDFTGVTHKVAELTPHQRAQLQALLSAPEVYVFHHEDENVVILPCRDPATSTPSVVNVYFARKTFTVTVDGDGGNLYVNGSVAENGFAEISVYAGTPVTLTDHTLILTGADGVIYRFTVSRNAYTYEWKEVPFVTPAADCTVSALGTRLNVNVRIEVHLADLVIETETGERVIYTQAQLDALNKAYAAAYERAAKRLTQSLGISLTAEDLRSSDLADETYKRYEAVVSEELAKVDPGYQGRAVNVYTGDSYTLYTTVMGQADADSLISVDLSAYKSTTQYTVSYISVDGTVHELKEELYIPNGNELGFCAAAKDSFAVKVADDGSTVVALCYDRNTYGFTPSVFFGDGANATEKFEGIPGIGVLKTCYGAPLQALAQMHIDDAHAAMEACGYGHEGYRLDEFSSLYALHCKNTGALKDTYTWPAREYGLVIGEYVICSYQLTVHYWDETKALVSEMLTVTYNMPFSEVLTAVLREKMNVVGYDITAFSYTSDGNATVDLVDTMPARDTELWAVYAPKRFVLVFDPNADDATAPQPTDNVTVTFDSPIGTMPATTRPGYIFMDWAFKDTEGNTVTVSSDTVVNAAMLKAAEAADGKLTLSAVWKEGPTTFTVQFLYQTLEGDYLLDATATMTEIPGITGQTAIEALLAYDETLVDAHVKPGFGKGVGDENEVLLGNGSTVYQIKYDRMTYHLTVYANGVPKDTEGYAYGATLRGQGSLVKSYTVSYVYGEDLSNYMAEALPYAAGYSVSEWKTVDWDTILLLADETRTVTEAIAYPLWHTVKALYTVDPTWGTLELSVNGESYGQIKYHYQNAYLPVGAEITVTAVSTALLDTGSLVFLGWVDLYTNTVISRDSTLSFTSCDQGLSCKALYVYLDEGETYHIYLNDLNGQLLWVGYETFEALDAAAKLAFIKEANITVSPDDTAARFEEEKGFTLISEENGIYWYETKRF